MKGWEIMKIKLYDSIRKTIQNFIMNTKVLYQWDKKMLLFQVLQVFSSIIMTYVGIKIPVEIVKCIENNNKDLASFLYTMLGYLGTYFVCNIISLDVTQYIYRNGGTLCMPYTTKIYDKIMNLSYEYLNDKDVHNKVGKVWLVLRNDYYIRNYVVVIPQVVTAFIGIIWYGTIVAKNSIVLFIVDIIVCVLGFLMLSYIQNKQEDYYDGMDLISRVVNYINKISMDPSAGKDIRIFGMKKKMSQKYDEALDDSNRIFSRLEDMYLKEGLVNEAFLVMLGIGSYVIFGRKTYMGELAISDFVFLITVITSFSGYLNEFLEYSQGLVRTNVAIDYIRELLEVKELNYDKKIKIDVENVASNCVIEFKNVTYKYPDTDEPILKNINLKLDSNKKLALIGLNGAGKTTLIKLLCGLYTPTEGAVLLNGISVSLIENMDEVVAALFQDSDLLPLTTDENIIGICNNGKKKESDNANLKKVIQEADFEKKYNKLKNKGNTLLVKRVNHDASDLSGGEKQKLLFARALYQNPKILILDEPTSALDPIAERKLYNDFSKITENMITVFVSHRLSSTVFCDEIVLLSDGEIIEKGSHWDLMKKNGYYAELFDMQGKYYKEEAV